MIVQLLRNKEVLQDTSLLSNRYDNKSTDIKINLVDEFVNESYFYYLICKSPDKNVNQFAAPLTLDLETKSLTYLVRSHITNTKGNWDFCLLIKELAIVGGIINDDGLIAISEHFVGKVKSGIITEEELGEQPLEEPLQIVYDRMLAGEAAINSMEGIRITNEGGRIDAETLRQEAEGQREIVKDTLQGWLDNPEQFKGDTGEKGIQGETGKSIEFTWNGTQLGVRIEGETDYTYVNLKGDTGDTGDTGDKGDTGDSLEFNWNGTQLGVRIEGETDYTYVNLKGDKGNQGDTGNGISSIVKTLGTGAAGTTDTYTITYTNDTTTTFEVYNGADGLGDMLKSVYDINNSGQVDKADDTDKFGGQSPSYYAKATDIPDISGKLDSTHNTDETAHSDIRASINNLGADATENSIVFETNYQSTNTNISKYYKKNGFVSIECRLKKTDGTSLTKNVTTAFATLPVGFRPTKEQNFAGISPNNWHPVFMRIATDGKISFSIPPNLFTGDITEIMFAKTFYTGGGTA